MENQPQTEYVADCAVPSFHILDIYDLRSNVSGCTASDKEIFFKFGKLSQPVVSNNTVIAIPTPEKNVLWLEITMHNIFGVHLPQPLKHTLHHLLHLSTFEFLLCLNSNKFTFIFS